jgi:single-stranded DNA-binding protein
LKDGDTTWHRVKAFKQLGENTVESLTQGDPVIAHGTITTDSRGDAADRATRRCSRAAGSG